MIKNKTLVIMGTHWKGLKFFDWKRRDCEIWMFNEAPNVKVNGKPLYPAPDALFQLHHEAIWKNPKNRSDEKHYEWLASGDTPPVYMQKKYKDVPKSVAYPLAEALKLTKNLKVLIDGQYKEFKYFSSSPEYALALAALEFKKHKKYTRIEVWGIELEHEAEYVYQRTGFAFWVGYLAGLGVEVILANSIFNSPIYGYEGDVAIDSDYLKKRIEMLTTQLGTDKERYNLEAQEFLASFDNLLQADVSKKLESDLNDLVKRNESAGILNGQIKECTSYYEKALAMEKAAKTSVFSMGEFDSIRHLYNNQYAQIKMETINLNSQIAMHLKNLLNFKKNSNKRRNSLDKLKQLIVEMMNKNMALLHIVGAIKENQFLIDLAKISIKSVKGEK